MNGKVILFALAAVCIFQFASALPECSYTCLAAGGNCTYDPARPTALCPPSQYCKTTFDTTTFTLSGVCTNTIALNGDCSANTGGCAQDGPANDIVCDAGTCRRKIYLSPGSTCSAANQTHVCGGNTYCNTDGTCVGFPAVGEVCSSRCAGAAICHTTGRCIQPFSIPMNDACSSTAACTVGLVCNSAGTCASPSTSTRASCSISGGMGCSSAEETCTCQADTSAVCIARAPITTAYSNSWRSALNCYQSNACNRHAIGDFSCSACKSDDCSLYRQASPVPPNFPSACLPSYWSNLFNSCPSSASTIVLSVAAAFVALFALLM